MVQVTGTKLILRFKFKKTGKLQYISHLDLVRTMHKVIVRAGLPLWYTEGFNPKPKMVFAAPLSIGTESLSEFMDLRLSEYIDPAEAMKRLNANMTEDMQAIDCYYAESKFTELKWMSYTVVMNTAGANTELAERCNAVLSEPVIEVVKNTKSGERAVDIRPLIKSGRAELYDGKIRVSLLLSADPSAFLNPEYVVDVLRNRCGVLCSEDLTSESYTIMRECAYFEDMREFR